MCQGLFILSTSLLFYEMQAMSPYPGPVHPERCRLPCKPHSSLQKGGLPRLWCIQRPKLCNICHGEYEPICSSVNPFHSFISLPFSNQSTPPPNFSSLLHLIEKKSVVPFYFFLIMWKLDAFLWWLVDFGNSPFKSPESFAPSSWGIPGGEVQKSNFSKLQVCLFFTKL